MYPGQGLGNQLWVYAVCRTLALDRGAEFSILGFDRFKGSRIMNLDPGTDVIHKKHKGPNSILPVGFETYYHEKQMVHPDNGDPITRLDRAVLELPPRTKIDGTFQSERYIAHRREEITEWFTVLPERRVELDPDLCLISFRGGEYRSNSRTLLPKSYYQNAMNRVRMANPKAAFLCVTDDPGLAKSWLPDVRVVSHRRLRIRRMPSHWVSRSALGKDFALLQAANYLILSNSSFSWWAAWTNRNARLVLAPKYWARFNTSDGYWSQGDSLTEGWTWLDREGRSWSSEECSDELAKFRSANAWA